MKKVEALQDLPAPAPQDLGLHHFKALQITAEKEREREIKSRNLSNKDNILPYH